MRAYIEAPSRFSPDNRARQETALGDPDLRRLVGCALVGSAHGAMDDGGRGWAVTTKSRFDSRSHSLRWRAGIDGQSLVKG